MKSFDQPDPTKKGKWHEKAKELLTADQAKKELQDKGYDLVAHTVRSHPDSDGTKGLMVVDTNGESTGVEFREKGHDWYAVNGHGESNIFGHDEFDAAIDYAGRGRNNENSQ